MGKDDIARIIEHTQLRPDAASSDIIKLCAEAVQYGFYSVCVNPCRVALAHGELKSSSARVTTVIGFPLGAGLTEVRICEARAAVKDGADELDIVMNIGMAKDGKWDAVIGDLAAVISATRDATHKIIIECCCLSNDEKIKAAEAAISSGAEFVKTSTGFGRGGAAIDDVVLLKSVAHGRAKIKAAGGIKTLADAMAMMKAGADLIGTSSGVGIIGEITAPPRA